MSNRFYCLETALKLYVRVSGVHTFSTYRCLATRVRIAFLYFIDYTDRHDSVPLLYGIILYRTIYVPTAVWVAQLISLISFEDRRSEPFSRNALSGSAPAGTDDTYERLLYNVCICIQYTYIMYAREVSKRHVWQIISWKVKFIVIYLFFCIAFYMLYYIAIYIHMISSLPQTVICFWTVM